MMNHSIYYHRGFDGVASAALVLKWLRFEGQPERVNLRPVDYDSPWTQTRLPGRSIVVDFMYHPDATQYWDPHDSTFPRRHGKITIDFGNSEEMNTYIGIHSTRVARP